MRTRPIKAQIRAPILALLFLFFSILLFRTTCDAAETLYENKTITDVYRGLGYEYSQRVTTDGLLDVHILTINLQEEHLTVMPLASKTEHGLKETLTRLMDTNGAVAGVNGDFFGMSGEYSAPFGLEIIDGKVTGASRAFNEGDKKSATLFISEANTPFLNYITVGIRFLNNGAENLQVLSYNRVTDAIQPFYIDRNAFETTKTIDARFPNLFKIVVDNGVITYISSKGETVTVPEKGYVVIINENTAAYHLQKFAIGQPAEVQLSTALDLGKMKMAISGGGTLLSAGYYTEDGYFIAGRQPRTAIGINQEQTKLILMVIDGRGTSIGATHSELAALMREYGAFNAMHLDGGGSSTLAVRESLQTAATVKNVPSDGAQRKLINGLGVFNTSTLSELNAIAMETDDFVFKGVPVRMRVYGLDRYLNKIELTEGFQIETDGGHYADGYFYPEKTGTITIHAVYGQLTAFKQMRSGELAELNVTQTIRLALGGTVTLRPTGKSDESFIAPVDMRGVSVEVVPPTLAVYTNGVLTGQSAGAGYIKLTAGGVVRYAQLIVGTRDVLLDSFEPRAAGVSYLAYPEGNAGAVGFNREITPGGSSIELTYQMQPSTSTQAAYVAFDPPIAVQGQPVGLKLTAYGDNSNNWLRGRVTDANGVAYTIDFARYIDWTGFQTVEAKLPVDAVYPIVLDRIYVAALDNTSSDLRRLYFDSVVAVYPIESGTGELPASTLYTDRKMVDLGPETSRAFTDITLLGDITSTLNINNYAGIQNQYKAEFTTKYTGSTFGQYLGKSDNIAANMPVYKWTAQYDSYKLADVNVINLIAANGNLYSSDPVQWRRLKNDLYAAGNNVLVMIDKNPQTSLPKKELELLHKLFVKTGKNILVASAEGLQSSSIVTDGVRYVNLGKLFAADGTVNAGFKTLRVRFFEDDIRYSLK